MIAALTDDRFDVEIKDDNIEDMDFGRQNRFSGHNHHDNARAKGLRDSQEFRKRGVPVILGRHTRLHDA